VGSTVLASAVEKTSVREGNKLINIEDSHVHVESKGGDKRNKQKEEKKGNMKERKGLPMQKVDPADNFSSE